MKRLLFATPITDLIPSLGLLLSRIVFGGFLLIGHGWGKLASFGEKADQFPDPLGIGSQFSLISTILCEVVCSALVVLGFATRIAVLPLVFMLGIAAFVIHGNDPLFMGGGAAKEPALLFLTGFALFFFTGPGRFSLDTVMAKKRKK